MKNHEENSLERMIKKDLDRGKLRIKNKKINKSDFKIKSSKYDSL